MFYIIIFIQGSISAFKMDPHELIRESLRVTKDEQLVYPAIKRRIIW